VLAVGGAGWYRWHSGHTTSGAGASGGKSTQARSSSADSVHAPFRDELGTTLSYATSYGVSVTRTGLQVMDVRWQGHLELTRLRNDGPGGATRASWQGTIEVVREGEPDAGLAATLQEGMKQPFFVEYGENGQIKGLRFSANVPRLAQTLVRSLVTSTQVTGAEPGATLWQSDEVDENGIYVAQYSREPDGALSKHRLRYRRSHAEKARLRIIQSEASFRFDRQGRLAELQDSEAVGSVSDLPLPETESSFTVRLKLDKVTPGSVEPEWLKELDDSEAMALTEAGTKSSLRAELDAARAGKMTAEQALLTLNGVLSGRIPKGKEGEAYNALVSHLRLDPKLIQPALEHIKRNGPLKKHLISALRDAGSPEAQAALRGLIREPSLTAEDRLQVVRGLSRVDDPTPETVKTLTDLLGDEALGEQAEYGLGGNVYRLARTNPALAKTTLDGLQSRLSGAQTDSQRQRALLALGNAGAESSLASIQEQLSSPSEMVQIAATDALRRIPGASADVLLVKQLREAKLPSVRIAAAEAMRYREPSAAIVAGLNDATHVDPEVAVRKAALDIDAYFAARSSVLRQAIRDAATSDPDPNMRQRAETYLASI